MCRHIAYLGESITLVELLLQPEHSLRRQSWTPNDMRGTGTVNADGFGVGWYHGVDPSPARYRRAMPLWGDDVFASLALAVSSPAVLAAVRSATVGMPVVESACAPFTEGPWLFSHNGVIHGWPDSMADLAAGLATVDLLTLDAPTDSALLWALVRHRLRAGVSPLQAVGDTVAEVSAAEPTARLNLLLTDGHTIAASTYGHSLWTRRGIVASEPFDEAGDWETVDDHRLVAVTRSTTTVRSI